MNETDTRVDYLQGQLFARNRQLHDTIEHANDLTAELAALTAERDGMRAVVEKYPKDAEGKPVTPGDIRWAWARIPGNFSQSVRSGRVFWLCDGDPDWRISFGGCIPPVAASNGYSTEAAAKAASED